MHTNEILTFQRKLGGACQLKHKYFAVMKTSEYDIPGEFDGLGGLRTIFTFYAKRGRFHTFTERPNSRPPLPLPHVQRYENQIAIIRCSQGWIEMLSVFENAMLREENSTGHWVEVQVNAQGCGVGVILTELCLIDPEIYTKNVGQSDENRAENLLDDAGTTLHQTCTKLVGLEMAAVPPSGGHVYFSAAIRREYTRLLIDIPCIGTSDQHQRFWAYETAVAREHYNVQTGAIEECAGYGRCNAYRRSWFFCDK